jgi:hypothetical protein
MRRFALIAALIGAMGIPPGHAGTEMSGIPPSGRLDCVVLRDGDPIGTDVSEFTRDGARLIVRTHTDIAVKVLYVTVYRFHSDVEEQWIDGQLVALTARANDDGTRKAVDLRSDATPDPQVQQVSTNGKVVTIAPGVMPSSFWSPASLQKTTIIESLTGESFDVIVKPAGIERVQIGGRAVEARRFVVRGGLNRDLWYAPDGQLLKIEFDADDGSRIAVVRKSL